MAHHIPTLSTDELLDRIGSANPAYWRHAPAARETRAASAAERRPRFERPAVTPRLTTANHRGRSEH